MDNSVIVSLRDIVVEFDGQRILDGLNLDIHDKEFVTLLGPSGCGKTTTLRLIAGFLEPNSGKVLLKGEDITGVPPYKRPVNTVFQKYALFPHLSVAQIVAFGIRQHPDCARICAELLELVKLSGRGPAPRAAADRRRSDRHSGLRILPDPPSPAPLSPAF
jgi:spermidine/putrescine transport system ATP-binding protein